jgi:hypothetical protein
MTLPPVQNKPSFRCMSPIKTLLAQLANRITAIGAAAAAAALLTYFRSEASTAIRWLFDPVARCLPWNQTLASPSEQAAANLSSDSTLADLFLITPDGRLAMYEKIANYVANAEPVSSYREAATSSGAVSGFSTELGVIVETTTEHGFLVSRIDLGSFCGVGTRFRNVYRVHFQDCFIAEEHWTQEIAVPTKHLTLRIHFPPRPATQTGPVKTFGGARGGKDNKRRRYY